MLSEETRKIRIKQIKEHLCKGGLIGQLDHPDKVMLFMRNNAKEFKDIVFEKRGRK